ncbi:MAG: ATP-binding protein [Gammaproteobacteria bacterium]|nr:ATP-binding protein [Gammaproteobacteria bacterium]
MPPVTATETAAQAYDQASDKPSDRPSTEEEEEQTQAATLRVPATLIDELLRLVGETLILTAQLQEKVRLSSEQNQSLLEQHDLFQELVGELEQQVDVGGVAYKLASQVNDSGFDTLELEQYNELHTVTHRLVEAAADSQELDQDIGQYLRSLDELLINQSRLQREVQDLVMRTRMVPVKTVVPRLQRAVRQTCRVTGKQANLVLEGTDTLLDSDILTSLVDPLMHMLRNAVDHGIESRDERIRNGKDPQGTIQLTCTSEGTQIVLRCRDDGAGLDLQTIRALAEKRGIIAPDEKLTDDELRRVILRPGFSTRGETTQTSGRGIGMDVVATQLQAIKGSILIHSEPGQGTEFELRLPVSLMTTHGLLVRVRKQVMAISTRGIEQILHPEDGSVKGTEDELYYEFDDEKLDYYQIDDLLQLPPDRRSSDRDTRPALLIREEALNCAVQVETCH